MPQKIITLPTQLANQIAAGEVVERPVSVVKELVENSVDAGSTSITVVLESGGIDLIEIRDNGEGIPEDSLKKALEKHSTSKISSLEDLHEVMTFGFRGEALASVSSVSEFTLSSKIQGQTGAKSIFTAGGETFEESDVAGEIGTIVRVKNLFFNTPARRNYLKKPRTEYVKIYEFIQKMALVYPNIHFCLQHDGKEVFNFPENQGIQARIYAIYGEDFSENILEVSHEFGGVKISGYITDPKVSFQNKARQVLFVNKRIISSPMIFKAIFDAYNRFIPHGTYPGYVLFVEVDPTQVDVNVHPRKMEVRFAGEQSIFRSVYHGIKNVLDRVSLSVEENSEGLKVESTGVERSIPNQVSSPSYYTGSGTKFKSYSPYTNTAPNPAQASISFNKAVSGDTDISSEDLVRDSGFYVDLHETPLGKIIGQAHNSYIILQTPNGVTMLDQHAIAERVIYEKLASNAYIPKIQQILGGIGVHLTALEKEVVETHKEEFKVMGFDLDILSHDSIMIQSIPDFVKKQNIEKIFREILGDISEVGSKGLGEVRHKIWAYTACRSAVKFGDRLSLFEMNALMMDASLDYSATCPHGRPVVYDIDLEELQKKYER